jgi:hypothetical protein
MTDDDRRASPRHEAYVPAEIETASGGQTIAITRDVGASGLLVLTRMRLAVGQAVKLRVAFGGRDDQVITGVVVREETLEPGDSTLWITKVAISVDPGDPVHAALFASLARE